MLLSCDSVPPSLLMTTAGPPNDRGRGGFLALLVLLILLLRRLALGLLLLRSILIWMGRFPLGASDWEDKHRHLLLGLLVFPRLSILILLAVHGGPDQRSRDRADRPRFLWFAASMCLPLCGLILLLFIYVDDFLSDCLGILCLLLLQKNLRLDVVLVGLLTLLLLLRLGLGLGVFLQLTALCRLLDLGPPVLGNFVMAAPQSMVVPDYLGRYGLALALSQS